MDKVRGRRRSPRAARPQAALEFGERPLAWADVAESGPRSLEPVASGRQWIGSAAALYLPSGGDAPIRLPWTAIDRADWLGDSQELRVLTVAAPGEQPAEYLGRLLGADRLLQLVRERVTASVVHTRSVAVTGGNVRVTARRGADHGRDLSWSVELPPGFDPGEPRVLAEAAAALASVRSEIGLDG